MPPWGRSILVTILLSAGATADDSGWDHRLADTRGGASSGAIRTSATWSVRDSSQHGRQTGTSAARARLPIRLVQSTQQESLAPQSTADPMRSPLPPPSRSKSTEGTRSFGPSRTKAVTTVISSLAIVLGLFAIVVWFARRANPKGHTSLPGEVVETLGRAPLSGSQEMHLVRVGNKLLLLSVTQTSAETLTEITDPAEIDRLAGICQQNRPDSITASFREVFAQLGK